MKIHHMQHAIKQTCIGQQQDEESICHVTHIFLENVFKSQQILEQILGIKLGANPDRQTENSLYNIWRQPIPGDTLCWRE